MLLGFQYSAMNVVTMTGNEGLGKAALYLSAELFGLDCVEPEVRTEKDRIQSLDYEFNVRCFQLLCWL